jgi:hypothetical protein
VKISALTVGGIYAYRRFTEGTAAQLKASRQIPPLAQFVVAWSVIYFALSMAVGPAPTLAGTFAIFIAIAFLLSNGIEISKDLHKVLADEPRKRRRRGAGKAPAGGQGPTLSTEPQPETRTV